MVRSSPTPRTNQFLTRMNPALAELVRMLAEVAVDEYIESRGTTHNDAKNKKPGAMSGPESVTKQKDSKHAKNNIETS